MILLSPLLADGTPVEASSDASDPFAPLTSPSLRLLTETLYRLKTKNSSNACRDDVNTFIRAGVEKEEWALRRLDSMGKPFRGVIENGLTFPGFASECTSSINGGKYCLVSFHFPSPEKNPEKKASGSPFYPEFRVGICVPTSCSEEEITDAVSGAASSLTVGATAELKDCFTGTKQLHFDIGAWIVVSVFSTILLLVSAGTIYDASKEYMESCTEKSSSSSANCAPPSGSTPSITDSVVISNTSHEILCKTKSSSSGVNLGAFLLCFSLSRNMKRLFHTSSNERTMQALHGIRFLSMAWITFGHTFSFALQWLFFRNPNVMSSDSNNFLSQPFANGTFAVDTFFFLSGFLVAYNLLREMKNNNGKFNITFFYLHRYLRMTPLMMAVIAFCANILVYLGSGPAWKEAIVMYDSWCKKNWWLNALYLQNFFNRENMCLSHTWYSAVDMQFYVISPIIIYLCYRSTWFAVAGIGIPLLITTALPIIFTLIYHFPGVPSATVPQNLLGDYFGTLYVKPYCRMGPYLVGIALAYLQFKDCGSFRIGKHSQIVCWVTVIAVNMAVIYSMGRVFKADPITDIESALYNGFARTVWAVTLAWLTFACTEGYASLLNKFLSMRLLIPLSRVTYGVYLVHPVLMAHFYGTRENVFDYSLYIMIYMVIGNLVISFTISFILSLLFESPIMAVENLLRGKQ